MSEPAGGGAPSVVIRAPSAGDRVHLAEFLRELGYPASIEEVERRLARLARDPNAVVLVAEWNVTPVGVATAHRLDAIHVDEPVAMLTALNVAEGHRGRGVGRSLVRAVEAWARGTGAGRLSITTGLQRAGAHAFYERLGYEHTGRRYLKQLQPPKNPLS